MTSVFESVSPWRRERTSLQRAGLTLGFVPTMGALHEGHLSLVRRSQSENDRTLVTIFVNPAQFDDPRDLAEYPRTLKEDVAVLRQQGVDFVLAPGEPELYPDGFRYRVSENAWSRVLEGASRPGHFDGVLTVVLKLLHIAEADRAYFGEKDWQQLTLVRGLAQAFFLPTAIVGCATIRDENGLALSSRNSRLSKEDYEKAPLFYQALCMSPTPEAAAQTLTAAGFVVDYIQDWDARRLGAVRLGGVRLIDNVPLQG